MSSHLARWLYQSRVGLFVASGLVIATSTTAGIVLSGRVGGHTGVLGEKVSKPTSSTNGRGNAPQAAGHAFTMTVQAVGVIGPGQSQTLDVTVRNPNNQNMAITGATGVVHAVSKPGCLPSWFTVEDWTPGASPTIAPANGAAVIHMTLDFADEAATNQDVCKSTDTAPVRIVFTLHATGAQA